MMLTKIKKMLKSKRNKKRQINNSASGATRNAKTDGIATRAAAARKVAFIPRKLTESDRQNAVRDLNSDIDSAKNLPPAERADVLRSASLLKRVLLNLDPKKKERDNAAAKQKDPESKKDQHSTNTTDLKKAQDDLSNAKANVGDKLSFAGDGPLSSITALKKMPGEMTASEISDAIIGVENAIKEGQVLLPADTSLLQRVLHLLKVALLELGGVDAELAVKDKDKLQALITAKVAAGDQGPATKAKVTDAINNVNKVTADIAARNPTNQSSNDSDNQALVKLLKRKKPEEMTASEISDVITGVEEAIKEGQVLLPADAGLLQRVLHSLKLALLELGGIDTDLAVKDKDKLQALITAKVAAGDQDPATKAKVTAAINDVNKVTADLSGNSPNKMSKNSDYLGLDVLRRKTPENLTTEEVTAALSDIERSIAEAKVLLPENASAIQRALYVLKMALLDLGNVNPKLRYDVQEQLHTILEERMALN